MFKIETKCLFESNWETLSKGNDTINSYLYPALKIGHYRAYTNRKYWTTKYFPCNNYFLNSEIKTEMKQVYRYIFENKFKDGLMPLSNLCDKNPSAKLPQSEYEYNFYIHGKFTNYWIRVNLFSDYCIYVHAYKKA